MPMEHHLDYEIRLSGESEYKSLYSWFLQEFTKEGKPVGRPVIPWEWSLWFTATQIQYIREVELKNDPDESNPDENESTREVIRATLTPAPRARGGRQPRFSMLGANRRIKDFSLSVYRSKDDQTGAQCRVWGSVSYTADFDFEDETIDDCVIVEVALSSDNFVELRNLLRDGRAADDLSLSVRGVSGFYSEWSPSVRTDDVKVLTSHTKDHPVLRPEDCAIEPPRLGDVKEFSLTFNRRTIIAPPQPEGQDEEVEEGDSDEDAPSKPVQTLEQQQHAATLQALGRVQESVKQLRAVLWVIAVLVLLGLIK